MTFGDFCMVISNKTEKKLFFCSGGCIHGCWLSGENGQAVNFRKLVLQFLRKRLFFKSLRRQGENTLCFPIYQQSCENVQLHPFFGQAVNFVKLFFWGACWVGVFFGGGVTHLALSPPCFFCFDIVSLLFCYCFTSLVSFVFETNIQCLPFFLLSLPFSLYVYLSISLSLSLLCVFFLPSLCSVFFCCLFFSFLVLGFVLLSLFLCLHFMI